MFSKWQEKMSKIREFNMHFHTFLVHDLGSFLIQLTNSDDQNLQRIINKCEKRNGREINFQRQLLHYFSLLSEANNHLWSILLENKMFLMDGYNELKSSESKSELNISAMGNFLFTAI